MFYGSRACICLDALHPSTKQKDTRCVFSQVDDVYAIQSLASTDKSSKRRMHIPQNEAAHLTAGAQPHYLLSDSPHWASVE